jgi:hypothetical protein
VGERWGGRIYAGCTRGVGCKGGGCVTVSEWNGRAACVRRGYTYLEASIAGCVYLYL